MNFTAPRIVPMRVSIPVAAIVKAAPPPPAPSPPPAPVKMTAAPVVAQVASSIVQERGPSLSIPPPPPPMSVAVPLPTIAPPTPAIVNVGPITGGPVTGGGGPLAVELPKQTPTIVQEAPKPMPAQSATEMPVDMMRMTVSPAVMNAAAQYAQPPPSLAQLATQFADSPQGAPMIPAFGDFEDDPRDPRTGPAPLPPAHPTELAGRPKTGLYVAGGVVAVLVVGVAVFALTGKKKGRR